MKVNYLLGDDLSHLASWRMRVKEIEPYLVDHGVDVCYEKLPMDCALNVFMKHFIKASNLSWMKKYGGVFDVTDPHFVRDDDLGDYYRQMIDMADVVTCSSSALKELIKSRCNVQPIAIGDAVEGHAKAHTWHGGKNILWFGHQKNLPTLKGVMLKNNCSLEVVSAFYKPERTDNTRLTPWSLDNMNRALARNDIVIIPGDPDDPAQMVVSANRASTGIWAGKVVVAIPLPAYESLSPGLIIDQDMMSGIEKARAMSEQDRQSMVDVGQDRCSDKLSPQRLAQKWYDVFKEL